MKNIAIIGYGYVGQGYHKAFPEAVIYDEPKEIGHRNKVNECDLALVSVPTKMLEDGSCDTSIVEEVVSWLETPLILIKSTIPPGTTDRLKERTGKRICFSPEYIGEGKYWVPEWKYPNPTNPLSHGFVIIGGDKEDCSNILDFFIPVLGPSTHVRIISSIEAEIVKYAENSWGAVKVRFANMLRDVCDIYGANWYNVREGWLDDPRVEEMHTAVFKDKKGWSGKCWPKDVMAFIRAIEKVGYNPKLLKLIWNLNIDSVLKSDGKDVHGNPEWASELTKFPESDLV
jgi:UDPglucose 6-dehydrogenase